MKSIIKAIENKIYEWVTTLYIYMSNKRHLNLLLNTEVLSDYKDTTVGLFNPVECVYFAMSNIFKNLTVLLVSGIKVDYGETITVNIYTSRPGFIIGYHGRCIDALRYELTKYFGRKPEIKLHEVKKPIWLGPFNY